MELGLSRGPALFRSPVATQQPTAQAAQGQVSSEADGLSEGDRASVASQKALDAQGPHAATSDPAKRDTGRDEDKVEDKAPGTKTDARELTEDEKRTVESLQRRDRAVRAHEAAHLAAAGGYAAGGPSYTTQQGPDGRSYAIGGEVPIDMSAERTPEATLRKAQTIRAAAMAPADPSGADKAIAAAASQMAQAAQVQMAEEAAEAAEASVPDEVPVETRRPAASEAGDAEPGEPSAQSSEFFAALREELSESAPTDKEQVAKNKRGKISKAYVAVAQTPARATLRCAACSGFH